MRSLQKAFFRVTAVWIIVILRGVPVVRADEKHWNQPRNSGLGSVCRLCIIWANRETGDAEGHAEIFAH
jgi:hypothetical protein